MSSSGRGGSQPADGASSAGGQYLFNADHLRRWRAKLADAASAQCSIGVYSDSIGWGAYSNNLAPTGDDATFRTAGYVAQLRNLFAARYGAVGEGFIPTGAATSVFTLAGGAFLGGPSRAGITGVRAFISGVAESMTATLPACTTIEIVYFWKQGGSAPFTYTIDGGASVAGPTQAADGTYSLKITGQTNAAHTLVVTGSAAGSVEIIAVGAWTNTATGVAVNRYARSGMVLANHFSLADPTTAVNAADQAAQISGAVAGLRTDLAVLHLSANNGTQYGPLTLAQFQTGLQAVCNNIAGQGAAVLLVGGPPVNPAGSLAGGPSSQAQYDLLMAEAAASIDHVAYLDLKALWRDWATANTLGLYADGIVHPKRAGHGDIAQMLLSALERPW